MAVAVLVAAATLLAALYLFLSTRSFGYWKRRNVPSVRPLPLFGNFWRSALRLAPEAEDVGRLYRQLHGHPYGGVFVGRTPALLLRDPVLAKAVLTKDFATFPSRTAAPHPRDDGRPLARNVFNAEGRPWRELRSRLTPSFTPAKTKRAFDVLSASADALVAHVARDEAHVDVREAVSRFSVDAAAAVLFGLRAEALEAGAGAGASPMLEMVRQLEKDSSAIHDFVGLASSRALSAACALLGEGSAAGTLAAFFTSLARQVLAARDGSHGKDIIHMLAAMPDEDDYNDSKGVAEQRVAAHMCSLLFAGAHKPAGVINCVLEELASNPELQNSLQAEVDSAFDDNSGRLSFEAVDKNMPLMDSVIAEALRLRPAEPVLTRVSRAPFELPGGAVLEAGTRVLIPVAALQRDPALFPQPESFDARRFAAGAPAPALYAPFGEGPRKCLGFRLGLLQAKVGVAALLRHFCFRFRPHAPRLRAVPRP